MPTRSVTIINTGVYSDDYEHRYSLTRCWDPNLAKLLFVMHNPSKAREVLNDDTVMACQNIAWLIGQPNHPNRIGTAVVDQLPRFGAIRVCNLYPAFATDPNDMVVPCPPVLRENDCELKRSCRWADRVICAWGKPLETAREQLVKQTIREIRAEKEGEFVLSFGHEQEHPIHPSGVKRLPTARFPANATGTNGRVSVEKRLLYLLQSWDV